MNNGVLNPRNEELDVCPFCGKKCAELIFNPYNYDYYVWCSNCGATLGGENMANEMIAKWNRRA